MANTEKKNLLKILFTASVCLISFEKKLEFELIKIAQFKWEDIRNEKFKTQSGKFPIKQRYRRWPYPQINLLREL